MMAVIDEPTLDAYQAATVVYNRNTYGEVAADHDEGLHAVVNEIWRRAIEARNAELFAVDVADYGPVPEPDDREAPVRRIEEPTRAKIAAALRDAAANYPEDLFPANGRGGDATAGAAMRHAYLTAARIAEGE